jgi:mono/diheme cytochrome c family protein
MRRRAFLLGAIVVALAAPARADSDPSLDFGQGNRFTEHGGAALYTHVCQACHMADGKGATGAGTYPALAADPKLAAAGYPVAIVVHGQNAMPPIGTMMTDAQVADVVNYVRTHFGNAYTDAVTAADVAAARK